MATKLDKLIWEIDPSRTLNVVASDVDRAVNTYPKSRATISTLDKFEHYLADFAYHVEITVLKLGGSFPQNKDFYWARCSNILSDEYGPNGWKTAFEMARTGKSGGLYRLLKTIADKMVENYTQNEISARISRYLNSLTIDEQLSAAYEYKNKYGYLIPDDFTSGNSARLKANFSKVLNEHPKIVQRIGRIGR